MTGKNKCKILKEIRQQIADANDIPFVTAQCKYQGECAGTCPKCEEELRYLEQELEKRKKTGKCILVAGLAAATLLAGVQGCQMMKEDVSEIIQDEMTQGMLPADPLS